MSEFKRFTFSPEAAADVLQSMGYRGNINREGCLPVVESATNGARFYVNFRSPRDDDPSKGFEEIQFDTGFAVGPDVNTNNLVRMCNYFNANYRFAKLAVVGNPNRYITMSLDLPVTSGDPAWFEHYVEAFIGLIGTFIEEIVETDVFRGDGCWALFQNSIELLHGATKDPVAAINLYRRAAEKGYAGSQNNLGDLYEAAEYLPKSDDFAVYWYTRSAERGEPTAYLSLSTLLSEKAVDRPMLIEALKFAFLAVERLPKGYNMKTAEACVERLTERLTEEEVEEAKTKAKSWMPLYQETRLMSDTPSGGRDAEEQPRLLH